VVHFEPEVAHLVRERREAWQDLDEHQDGSVTLSFDTSDLAWPSRWVLSWQDSATVLGPAELVRMVREAAEAISARYTDRDGSSDGLRFLGPEGS
jgi:predicted DNA-binding transcriptional regulator YafY